MLTQVEIRTLSGEVRYGSDDKQVLPELCGSILLPKNGEMLVRVCEHRKSVTNGTYRSKPLSDATLRKFRLRPEYARTAAPAAPSVSEDAEQERRRRIALAALA
jgi:hypothetical protein